ncbi:MAG TPA: HDIG domain-containing protein [Spirochaetia bacterium]|nr:HDIG domain-containing protein [Spirochaetia bacterium]
MKSDRRVDRAMAADLLRRLVRKKWTTLAVAAAYVVAVGVVLVATQSSSVFRRDRLPPVTVGALARVDYVVEKDFLYLDTKATEIKRDARERLVPPVFVRNDSVSADALLAFDRFSGFLSRLKSSGLPPTVIGEKVQADFPDRIGNDDLLAILRSNDLVRLLGDARSILEAALSRGIVDLTAHDDEVRTAGAVTLGRGQDGLAQSEEIPADQVLTQENLKGQTIARVQEQGGSPEEKRGIVALLGSFAVVNCFYDAELTRQQRNRARADVDPVVEKLSRGQVLARRGDVITEPIALRIQALGSSLRTLDVMGIVGSALFLVMTFCLAAYLLTLRGTTRAVRHRGAMLFLCLGLGHFVVSALVVRFVGLPDWVPVSAAIPTATMSMLVAILVSTPAGVVFSLVVSLALLLLTGLSVQSFLFAFLTGVAATAVVLDAERRLDLVRAGLVLSFLSTVALGVIGVLAYAEPGRLLSLAIWGAANGFFSSILALGFLPVFEHLLNAPTRFRLMELSDLNSPIFRRMLSQAPGTYTHSISVANLAETACEAIGANALLARVSAYYHDIGKVEQADYFIENQKAYNRHDEMRPSLSAAVIKSHVRIGIEKARELKLPQEIVDIIAQHHGRGLITYFYNQAVKEGKSLRISRDDFSYPGARPRTREAAVLMLADGVEAASRSLKRPTVARLQKLVQDMIMEKFSSGELGDSNLTLRDLESIRKSFVHILEGYFHTRIEYPKIVQARSVAAK